MDKIILFFSTNYAIWANEVLESKGVTSSMTSVPRELSSDCGYCIKFNDDKKKIEKILIDEGIEYDRIVEL
ncbi:MAG: hypothetical protein CR982_05985 [Candidatus Cloacimonadota bacterium]|nr:MAG: hypothetical protein CR982_05985 [Candidatus Cloacimonadota bacterium]PIE78070.1 MAG: hypothetical protein CSA15_09545 [Candidatus Delongbacteria bacterium]